MTFTDYIQNRRVTGTPNGDFVADTKFLIGCARQGIGLPHRRWRDPKTRDQLICFMMFGRGACHEAIEAAKQVWAAYRRAQRRRT
jgi:hypothetical protein